MFGGQSDGWPPRRQRCQEETESQELWCPGSRVRTELPGGGSGRATKETFRKEAEMMANQGTPVIPWARGQVFIIPGQLMKSSVNRAASPLRGGLWLIRAADTSQVSPSPAQSSHLRFCAPSSLRAPQPPSLPHEDLRDHIGPPCKDKSDTSLSAKPRRRKMFIQLSVVPEDREEQRKNPLFWSMMCGPNHTVNTPGGADSKSPEGDRDRAGGRQRAEVA